MIEKYSRHMPGCLTSHTLDTVIPGGLNFLLGTNRKNGGDFFILVFS